LRIVILPIWLYIHKIKNLDIERQFIDNLWQVLADQKLQNWTLYASIQDTFHRLLTHQFLVEPTLMKHKSDMKLFKMMRKMHKNYIKKKQPQQTN